MGDITLGKIIAKKVQLTELFYDLVFVYAISQTTGLIHHVPANSSFVWQLLVFTVIMIVFINTWMIETVFTNRYGKNSIGNIIFFMIDMGILLFMSNNISGEIKAWFQPFAIATSLLTFTLVLQYVIVYLHSENPVDHNISRLFILIIGSRAILLLIGAFLPYQFGVIVALLGVFFSWALPGIFTPIMRPHPINFPHLLERLTALIIILFGETIVDLAPYFTMPGFNIISIVIFVIVCSLFMSYITQFDHFIDEKQAGETGNRLIYLHYLILFGISLVTVSLSFIHEESFSQSFAVSLLYIGIALFYFGLFLADYYDRQAIKKYNSVRILFAVTTVVGLGTSVFLQKFEWVAVVTMLVTLINAVSMSFSMVKQLKKVR